jgi:RimJ/RimL family protein N-acetyltransferase
VDRDASSTQTEDLMLRDVTEDDFAIFFEHQRDPVANRIANFPPRTWGAFAAHWAKVLADRSVTKRTVLVEGRVAGNIVTFEQDGEREVGYWIGREYWGKGIATEALSQFLDHIEVHRPLYAVVAKHNVGSIRVLKKCGFTTVGEEDEGHILKMTVD